MRTLISSVSSFTQGIERKGFMMFEWGTRVELFSWKKRMRLEEIGKRIGERRYDSSVMKIGVVRKNCGMEIKVGVLTFLIGRTGGEYSCVQLN